MGRFKLYFIIFLINLYTTDSQISDKRLCVDEECKKPVSLAYTLMNYYSPDPRILSFSPNAKVTVYSKSAGSRTDLWGAEINGKRGYLPAKFLRETKVLNKPNLLVDTEISNETETPKVPVIEENLDPDKVQEAFEVIDGTTIPVDPQTIVPSTTETPILATASPADVASQKEATQSLEAEKDANKPSDAKDTDKEKLEQENIQIEQEIDSSEAEKDAEKPSDVKDIGKEELDQESIQIEETKIDSEPSSTNTVQHIETKQTELLRDHQESIEEKTAEDQDKLEDKPEENKMEEIEGEGVIARLSNWIIAGTSQKDNSASNIKDDDVEIETDEDDEGEDDEGEDDEDEDDEDQENEDADDERENSKEESKVTSMPETDTKHDPTADSNADQSYKGERKTVESENEESVSLGNDEISKFDSFKASGKIEAEKTDTSQNSKSDISDSSKKEKVFEDSRELEQPETSQNSKPDINDLSNEEKLHKDSSEVVNESNEEVDVKSREDNVGHQSPTGSAQIPKIDVPLKEGSREMPVLSSPFPTIFAQQSSSQVPKTDVPLKEGSEEMPDLPVTEAAVTEIPLELPKPLEVSVEDVTPNPAHLTPKAPTTHDPVKEESSDEIEKTLKDEKLSHENVKSSPKVLDEIEKTSEDPKSDGNIMSSPKVLPLESPPTLDHTKRPEPQAIPGSLFDSVENIKKPKDPKVESPSSLFAQKSSPPEPTPSNYDPYASLNVKNDSETSSKDDDDLIKTESNSSQEENSANEGNKVDIPDHTHTFEDAIKRNTEKMHESEVLQKELSDVPKAVEEVKAADPGSNLEKSEVKSSSAEELETPGILDNVYSFFGSSQKKDGNLLKDGDNGEGHTVSDNSVKHQLPGSIGDELFGVDEYCDADPIASDCRQRETNKQSISEENTIDDMDLTVFTSDILTYLVTTAVSVIIFLLGYIVLDRSRREGPLIAKLDKLEKECLVLMKENQILQEKVEGTTIDNLINTVPNAVVDELKEELMELQRSKAALEEQVQSLEKELENSTEVGMELNKMLSDILNSQSGSDTLKANIEQLQRQLVEQQATINSINETLSIKDTENHELHLELEISNKKVVELQSELDKLLLNILKIEEEKDLQQNTLEAQVNLYKQKYEEIISNLTSREESFNNEIQSLKMKLTETQRSLELKTKEYDILKENLESVQNSKNSSDTLKSLVDASSLKAELEQLKSENQTLIERLRQEEENRYNLEKKLQSLLDENSKLKDQYDEADKQKLEAQTKLEVLSNYFKEKETQMQKELSKHESMWLEKQGEASSTVERIKFMQEELQNYKAQNEALKQEILAQEVDLKSQISVLEKKVNDNWVLYRQTERRLEDAKQEAAQLRNRLTLRERAIIEEKAQNRLQSPLEQNGELPLSPLHMESPASPSMLFGGSREHIANSPPIPPPGLPPFLPPPPPFMPPPPGMPPFMPPPPPGMFPGDHRPPPLGRMSSPPLNSRFSPDSRVFSPYDRNSPSPTYDSEYDASSPPPISSFSPYGRDDRRDYKRPMPQPLPPIRTNGRSQRGANMSSGGSGHSNESLERIHKHSKV